MAETGHTWLVLVRDVSHAVRISEQPRVFVATVFDPDSGHILSASPGATAGESLKFAFETAIMTPADPFEPGPPARVLCVSDIVSIVASELSELLPVETPPIDQIAPETWFDDVLDSVIGLLSGRPQPHDGLFPTPADWTVLHEQALRYRQVEPWKRWRIAGQLSLVVRVHDTSARYLAIVIGENTTQRGMILYPGGTVPNSDDAGSEHAEPLPPHGTLLFYLDEPSEVPLEYRNRAIRYGWPMDTDLFPILVTGGPDGPGDIAQSHAQHMALALAAILEHDANETATITSGALKLSPRRDGHYRITSVR